MFTPSRDSDGQFKLKTEAFASKTTLLNGVEYKLFKRIHGKKYDAVPTGQITSLDFIVPYANAKLETIEILNGEVGDSLSFEVIHPNGVTLLNTFGFDVYITKDYYKQHSQYDADVFQGLIFRIKYTNNGPTRPIYTNYVLNEVKL